MSLDHSDDNDGIVQSGTATVFPLEYGIRVTRANTKVTTFYSDKMSRLGSLMHKRLSILEGLFYEKSPGLKGCSKGHISKPEHRFECYSGRIDFFYSSDQRCFYLLDFAFYEGGGGGLPVTDAGEPVASSRRSMFAAISFAERWVARLFIPCQAFILSAASSCIKSMPVRLINAGAVKPLFSGRRYNAVAYTEEEVSVSGLGAFTPHSILADYVITPLQLENHYARSILAGEAICDVALRSSFGHTILVQAKRRPKGTAELYEESACALGVLFAGRASSLSGANTFVVMDALGHSAVTDDRLLPVIRGELAAHLSIYVADLAAEHRTSAIATSKPSYADELFLMKKYSMLADLVALSMKVPSCEAAPTDLKTIVKDYAAALKGSLLKGAVAAFGAFDASIHVAVADFGTSAVTSDDAEISTLHRRALELARALLEPPNG